MPVRCLQRKGLLCCFISNKRCAGVYHYILSKRKASEPGSAWQRTIRLHASAWSAAHSVAYVAGGRICMPRNCQVAMLHCASPCKNLPAQQASVSQWVVHLTLSLSLLSTQHPKLRAKLVWGWQSTVINASKHGNQCRLRRSEAWSRPGTGGTRVPHAMINQPPYAPLLVACHPCGEQCSAGGAPQKKVTRGSRRLQKQRYESGSRVMV